jgi:hypothetical protein
MPKITFAAVALVIAAILAASSAAGAVIHEGAPLGGGIDSSSHMVIRGCAIRLTNAGPYLHMNSSHDCTGFAKVAYTASGWLEITSDSALPVVSVSVSPDETLSTHCILAGARGGGKSTLIRFFNACTGKVVKAQDKYLHGSGTNVWVTIISYDSKHGMTTGSPTK